MQSSALQTHRKSTPSCSLPAAHAAHPQTAPAIRAPFIRIRPPRLSMVWELPSRNSPAATLAVTRAAGSTRREQKLPSNFHRLYPFPLIQLSHSRTNMGLDLMAKQLKQETTPFHRRCEHVSRAAAALWRPLTYPGSSTSPHRPSGSLQLKGGCSYTCTGTEALQSQEVRRDRRPSASPGAGTAQERAAEECAGRGARNRTAHPRAPQPRAPHQFPLFPGGWCLQHS